MLSDAGGDSETWIHAFVFLLIRQESQPFKRVLAAISPEIQFVPAIPLQEACRSNSYETILPRCTGKCRSNPS